MTSAASRSPAYRELIGQPKSQIVDLQSISLMNESAAPPVAQMGTRFAASIVPHSPRCENWEPGVLSHAGGRSVSRGIAKP